MGNKDIIGRKLISWKLDGLLCFLFSVLSGISVLE
jgi:hypothetical protein